MLIGNDIIDLSQDRDHHPRFPRRILDDLELKIFEDSGFDPVQLWLRWAVKESVYKLEKRRDQTISFSPREFSVNLKTRTVTWRGRQHFFESVITADFIHVWAVESVSQTIAHYSRIQDTVSPAIQSKRVRELGTEVIGGRLKIDPSSIRIQTDAARLPYAIRLTATGEERINCVVSLSHDGAYVGVAIGFEAESV